jgi:hypothetical protein
MSAFGVKVGRYLERGRLGRNVRCRQRLLVDAFLGSGQVLQLTRRPLGGLYVDACHPRFRVYFELLLQL